MRARRGVPLSRTFAGAALGGFWVLACQGTGPTGHVDASVAAPSASAPNQSARTPGATTSCGQIPCRTFRSAGEAFQAVLERKPLVLGVGEAHAQRGTESIEPAVRRFTHELLPLLRGIASDLVVEILLPNAGCQKEGKAVAREQRVVTEKQTASTRSDYVLLASAAREVGIVPHALTPSCDDLSLIASAGPEVVTTSLTVVTRLATSSLDRLLEAQDSTRRARLVVAYGGAMHNDARPRSGHEKWSFGPTMIQKTRARYIELDLIVPEFIADSESWRALSWVAAFDREAHPESARLLEPSPGSFVLVFPKTK